MRPLFHWKGAYDSTVIMLMKSANLELISNDAGLSVQNQVELLAAYGEKVSNDRYLLLAMSHYVHNLAVQTITAETRLFLPEVVAE
jgi:hypothetical protein